jgi:ATPase subunit of ABC transporter with duplicated ATPase domains
MEPRLPHQGRWSPPSTPRRSKPRSAPLRWRKTPGRPLPRPRLPARPAAPRRTDQPPRRRIDPLAGGIFAGFPGAVIFVTHDRYFLDVIATRIIEIDQGKAFSHPGNYTAYLETKALRRRSPSRPNAAASASCARNSNGSAPASRPAAPNPATASTFYEIEGIEAPPEEREMDLLIPPPPDLGNTVVESGKRRRQHRRPKAPALAVPPPHLSLRPGQCTGIVGRNGVGKTTLLKLCLGQIEPDRRQRRPRQAASGSITSTKPACNSTAPARCSMKSRIATKN